MTDSAADPDIRSVVGWILNAEPPWDATDDGGADLVAIRMPRPSTLELDFYLLAGTTRTISFSAINDLEIQGNLQWQGETEAGWEVLESSMFTPEPPLDDGRYMYVLELPTALMTFKSNRGQMTDRS